MHHSYTKTHKQRKECEVMLRFSDRAKISDIIKETRLEKGYTQAQIAEKLGITARAVMNIEKGDSDIKFKHIYKLCEIFDCDIGYLMGEYKTKKHVVADVQKAIGLSEKAIETLIRFKEYDGMFEIHVDSFDPADMKPHKDNIEALNLLLEHDNTYKILSNIARFLFSRYVNVAPLERESGHKEIISGKDISKIELFNIQSALDRLKEDIFVQDNEQSQ